MDIKTKISCAVAGQQDLTINFYCLEMSFLQAWSEIILIISVYFWKWLLIFIYLFKGPFKVVRAWHCLNENHILTPLCLCEFAKTILFKNPMMFLIKDNCDLQSSVTEAKTGCYVLAIRRRSIAHNAWFLLEKYKSSMDVQVCMNK